MPKYTPDMDTPAALPVRPPRPSFFDTHRNVLPLLRETAALLGPDQVAFVKRSEDKLKELETANLQADRRVAGLEAKLAYWEPKLRALEKRRAARIVRGATKKVRETGTPGYDGGRLVGACFR